MFIVIIFFGQENRVSLINSPFLPDPPPKLQVKLILPSRHLWRERTTTSAQGFLATPLTSRNPFFRCGFSWFASEPNRQSCVFFKLSYWGKKGQIRQNKTNLDRELSCDPNPQYFLKNTAVQMRGVLPYKWEAYCSTNERCTVGLHSLEGLEARKAQRYNGGHTALQIGGVLQYFLETSRGCGFWSFSDWRFGEHPQSASSPQAYVGGIRHKSLLSNRLSWGLTFGERDAYEICEGESPRQNTEKTRTKAIRSNEKTLSADSCSGRSLSAPLICSDVW